MARTDRFPLCGLCNAPIRSKKKRMVPDGRSLTDLGLINCAAKAQLCGASGTGRLHSGRGECCATELDAELVEVRERAETQRQTRQAALHATPAVPPKHGGKATGASGRGQLGTPPVAWATVSLGTRERRVPKFDTAQVEEVCREQAGDDDDGESDTNVPSVDGDDSDEYDVSSWADRTGLHSHCKFSVLTHEEQFEWRRVRIARIKSTSKQMEQMRRTEKEAQEMAAAAVSAAADAAEQSRQCQAAFSLMEEDAEALKLMQVAAAKLEEAGLRCHRPPADLPFIHVSIHPSNHLSIHSCILIAS